MAKVQLTSGKKRKGIAEYDIEHAQRILRLQKKFGIKDGKQLASKDYEFNGKDIVRISTNKGATTATEKQ